MSRASGGIWPVFFPEIFLEFDPHFEQHIQLLCELLKC